MLIVVRIVENFQHDTKSSINRINERKPAQKQQFVFYNVGIIFEFFPHCRHGKMTAPL